MFLPAVIMREREMNGQHIKVLVVEHDPVHAGLLQDMLRPVSQFDLSAAGRLDEALRQLGAGAFDIMLLDLRLPDRLGLAAYRDLRHLLPALPIVVLTGPAEETYAPVLDAVLAAARCRVVHRAAPTTMEASARLKTGHTRKSMKSTTLPDTPGPWRMRSVRFPSAPPRIMPVPTEVRPDASRKDPATMARHTTTVAPKKTQGCRGNSPNAPPEFSV